jgi:hypothetical protein
MALRLFAAALAAAILVALGTMGSTGTVSAHEHRAVGNYEFVVGWTGEPAISDEPNALDLRISFFANGVPEESEEGEGEHTEEGVPVVGAEETLQAEIIAGGGAETRELTLEPAFGEEGAYEGLVIPVEPGDYTFHIFGDIEGFEIDESFTSGPDTFSVVEDPLTLQFPSSGGTGGDGEAPAPESSESDDDSSTADTALIVAIVAIAAAIIAAGIAVYAVRSRA